MALLQTLVMNLKLLIRYFSQEDYRFAFKQENVDIESRYYVESDGKKYYLVVQPNGVINTLLGSDLVIGSSKDTSTRFRTIT